MQLSPEGLRAGLRVGCSNSTLVVTSATACSPPPLPLLLPPLTLFPLCPSVPSTLLPTLTTSPPHAHVVSSLPPPRSYPHCQHLLPALPPPPHHECPAAPAFPPKLYIPSPPLPLNPMPLSPLPQNPMPLSPLPLNPMPLSPLPLNPMPLSPLPLNPTPLPPLPLNPMPLFLLSS